MSKSTLFSHFSVSDFGIYTNAQSNDSLKISPIPLPEIATNDLKNILGVLVHQIQITVIVLKLAKDAVSQIDCVPMWSCKLKRGVRDESKPYLKFNSSRMKKK